jgi:hypothetical protein
VEKSVFKKIVSVSLLASIFIMGGCSRLDPAPKAIDVEPVVSKMDHNYKMSFEVKAGESLKDLIRKLQIEKPEKIFVDKTESNIVFEESLPEMNPVELQKYIKLTKGKTVTFRKFSEKIYSIEEIIPVNKKDFTKQGTYEIPNMEFEVNGEFTYAELFNLMREQGVNLYVDIYDNSEFKYDNTTPEFTGTLKSFLNFISAKERLFVIVEDDGIRLKDVETVTYNLKLPKVKLDPVLTPDGGSTAVTVSGSISGNVQDSTAGSGSLSPLEDLKEQMNDMIGEKAKFAINDTQGTLSITGDYESIKTADKLVDDFHDIYGKAIKLEFHVYEVALDNENAFGIDYSMLKSELIADTVQTTTNISTGLTGALTLGAETAAQQFFSRSGTIVNSEGAESVQKTQGLIFKHLNRFGKTTVVTKPTLGTINNLPVKLDVVDSIDYVYSINQSATNTAAGGVDTPIAVSSTIQPEIKTVTTGFSLVLHPKTEGEFIKVAIKNIASNLNGLIPYTYGENDENVIRLKDVSAREFDETVKIKEGEIAIIGGYMYEKKHSLKNGLPYTTEEDGMLDAITSAKEAATNKVEIVITISAKVI